MNDFRISIYRSCALGATHVIFFIFPIALSIQSKIAHNQAGGSREGKVRGLTINEWAQDARTVTSHPAFLFAKPAGRRPKISLSSGLLFSGTQGA